MLLFYLFVVLSAIGAVLVATAVSTGWMAALWGLLFFCGGFLALTLAFGLVFLCSIWLVDLSREQKKRSAYFSFLSEQFLFFAVFFGRIRVRTKGLELVPRDQTFLLVSNHISDVDPAFFLYRMPWAKLGFISKKENYSIYAVNKIMHRLHCLPIDRENDRAALKTILKAVELLQDGDHSMAVFPEGYESKDGKLLPFRWGAFKIAQRAQKPIVVCVLRGAQQVTKNLFRRPTIVEIEVLGVIPAQELTHVMTRDVSSRVHEMMEQALNREGI